MADASKKHRHYHVVASNDSVTPLRQSKSSKEKTLYVGNLSSRVSEGMLIKAFSKYGNLSQVRFLWHMTGPKRGQPRGFAFVEYETKNEAIKAKEEADGISLLGRRAVVRFALPKDDDEESGHFNKPGMKMSGPRLTKAQKIRAIEEKLKQMQQGSKRKAKSSVETKVSVDKRKAQDDKGVDRSSKKLKSSTR